MFSDFATAVGQASITGGQLYIGKSELISQNLTIPPHLTLVFRPGAILTIAQNRTLTVQGGLAAGLSQLFDGPGMVYLGDKVQRIFPEWWYPGLGDYTEAINRAILAMNGNGQYLLFSQPIDYEIVKSTAQLPDGATVECLARATIKITNVNEGRVRALRAGNGCRFVNVNIDGGMNWSQADDLRWGICGDKVKDGYVQYVYITGCFFKNLHTAVRHTGAQHWVVSGNRAIEVTYFAIGDATAYPIKYNQFVGNQVENAHDYAICVGFGEPDTAVTICYNLVMGNVVDESQLTDIGPALGIEPGTGYNQIHHNIFLGNIVRQQKTDGPYRRDGISLGGYGEYNAAIGNALYGSKQTTNLYGIGIYAESNRFAIIADNVIQDYTGNGISARSNEGTRISGNIIRDCGTHHPDGAICLNGGQHKSHNVVVTNNLISFAPNYSGSWGGGIVAKGEGDTGIHIVDNIIDGYRYVGILLSGNEVLSSKDLFVQGNRITAGNNPNNFAISIRHSERVRLQDNIIANNSNELELQSVRELRRSLKGTATIDSNQTYVDVPHDLARVPANGEIWVIPTNSMGQASKFWIDEIKEQTFRINLNIAPGVSATFAWMIGV
jgi:parallel beta-helix repeat protein